MAEIIKCSPSQAKGLIEMMEGRIPVMLFGPPGVGKSSTVKEIAAEKNFLLIDVRGTMLQPSDVSGIPVPVVEQGVTKWFRPDWLPSDKLLATARNEKGEKYAGIIFFLDEMPSSIPAVQVAFQQLLLDRCVGDHKLPDPDKCWIVAAGNQLTDKGVVYKLPAPVADRMICMTFEITLDQWISWAVTHDIHPIVTGFHRSTGGNKLAPAFSATDSGYAFPTPRGWENVSKILRQAEKNNAPDDIKSQAVFGTVGAGVGLEFMEFSRIEGKLPDVKGMLEGNVPISVPKDLSVLHVMASALGQYVNDKNFGKFMKIIDHEEFPKEFAIVAYSDAVDRRVKGIMTDELSRKFQKDLTPYAQF